MYSNFKTQVLVSLDDKLDADALAMVERAMDTAAIGYVITEQSTEIIVSCMDEWERAVQAYTVCRKIGGLSEQTLKTQYGALMKFARSINKPMHDVRDDDVLAYLYQYQNERDISNRSLEWIRTTICGLFKWMAAKGRIERDPCASIGKIKF